VLIKVDQGDLQKCITWPKFFGGKKKIGKGMCEFMFSPKEIEHSNENKVLFF
jgi:hypothetical protein